MTRGHVPSVRIHAAEYGLIVLATAWCAGKGRAQEPSTDLSADLAVIVAAWHDNAARIQSLQMSGTIILGGKMLEGLWDLDGQTHNSQTTHFSFWRDGANTRSDRIVDREFDPNTREIRYNLPYGQFITKTSEIDKASLYRSYGTTQSTSRLLVTPETSYKYSPEANLLHVHTLDTQTLERDLHVSLALNRTLARDYTWPEYLDKMIAAGQRRNQTVRVKHVAGGLYQFLMAWQSPPDKNGSFEGTVDLDRGGNLVRYSSHVNGQVVGAGEFEYIDAGGAWVLARAMIAEPIGPDGTPFVSLAYEVRPETLRINAPVDPRVFTFEGLEVRDGTFVFDKESGEEYFYNDAPMHLKMALAQAKQELERSEAAPAQGDSTPQKPSEAATGRPANGALVNRAPSAEKERHAGAKLHVVDPQSAPAVPADRSRDTDSLDIATSHPVAGGAPRGRSTMLSVLAIGLFGFAVVVIAVRMSRKGRGLGPPAA